MSFFTASNQRILCTAFGVEVPGGSARLNQMTLMNIYSKIDCRLLVLGIYTVTLL